MAVAELGLQGLVGKCVRVLFMLDNVLDSDQSALWMALIGHTVQLKDLLVT